MRALILSIAFFIAVSVGAKAQDTDIQAVIGNQIEAFKADDFDTAFTFASPNIQGIFRTPENFGRMVSQGYPMVWRPAKVQYLDLEERAGTLLQRVMITDQSGRVHMLAYAMLETPNGWKINGVQILKNTGATA